MTLWPHQQRFIDSNPSKALLVWECRCGKTLAAVEWAKKRKSCLIVCPKQLAPSWRHEIKRGVVMTKENFKKGTIEGTVRKYKAIIVDESHVTASPLFTKGRSQLAAALYNYIKDNPTIDVLLLTATPIRNDPSSLHTLLCYIGVNIPWATWREEFYSLEYRPYLPRPAYFPVADWRQKIRKYLTKYADIVSLQDVVGYLPPAIEEVVEVPVPRYYAHQGVVPTWTDRHLHEQLEKPTWIRNLGIRKVIVVAHYTAQIDTLAKELSKDRLTFVLDGRTKDPAATIKEAQEADECFFIVQASMGVGFDGWMFGAMVFASMSHSVVSHTQMKGRLRHPLHLKPLLYYYLIGGVWDKMVYDSIKAGEDFNPHKYASTP